MFDYTPLGYVHLLDYIYQEGYEFIPFERELLKNPNRSILLRHDVDADPEAALQMARIEQSKGICSTYFFMLRSPLYNIFSHVNQKILLNIVSLGHNIGLHFDERGIFLGLTEGSLNEKVSREVDVLKMLCGQVVTAVSFHQPSAQVLSDSHVISDVFLNTYDRKTFANYEYISDTNKSEKLGAALKGVPIDSSIQLNIHPLWWFSVNPEASTTELWNLAIERNFMRNQSYLIATERAYGDARKMELK